MGVIRDVAARVQDASPNQYQCVQCLDTFEVQFHTCPNCDSFSVERRVERP